MGVISNLNKYFFDFENREKIKKNKTGKKFQKLFGINLIKYSSEFLTHIKKHLYDSGSPTHVQNNCIKLSGFGVDIRRFFDSGK